MLYQNICARWRTLTIGVLSLNLISFFTINAQSEPALSVRVAPKEQNLKPPVLSATNAELVIQLSHGFGVTDVEFSPDSSVLASAGADGAIKLWDTKTLELRQELNTSETSMGDGPYIAFTSDGDQLICAGRYVKIWNLKTGKSILITKAASRIRSMSLSPDGRLLAIGWYQGVQVWRINTQQITSPTSSNSESLSRAKMLWEMEGATVADNSLAFSGDGRLAIGLSHVVRVVEASTGRTIQSFKSDSQEAEIDRGAAPVAFRSDNSLAMGLGSIQLWSGKIGSKVKKLPITDIEAASHLEFSRDGQTLLVVRSDIGLGRLRVYDMATSRTLKVIEPEMPDIASAALSPDGKYVANGVSFNVYATQLWNGQTGKLISTWEGRNGGVNDVAVSANLRYLTTATDDGPLRVWDTTTNRLSTMGNKMRGLHGVAFSPDGRRVSNDRGEVWDITTGKLERVLPKGKMSFMPEVPYVARKTKKPFMTGEKEEAELFDLALSPDGRISAGAVTGMNDDELNAVKIWDSNTGALLHQLASDSWVESVCFSRNGKVLIVGYGDGSIQLWNTSSWKLQQKLPAHTGSVNSLRLTPSGKQFLSAGNDYQVKIWDSASGALKATLVILPPTKEKELSKDWLIYTPQGYYNGSAGAEKWMRWRNGNQLHPASYGRHLRKPNLLKSVLQ